MSVQHLTSANFDTVIAGAQPVLVDFFATWCGPCKMLSPVIEQLAAELEGKAAVCKLDIDQEMAIAELYGVQSVPTVVLFQNGREMGRIVGYQPKTAILNLLGQAKA